MKRSGFHLPVVLLGLAGCGSAPVVEPPPPIAVEASVIAATDSNPDAAGRASPLVVRIYELADAETFKGADFFALWNQEAPTLAAALVKRHEVVLAPDSQSTRPLTLDPRTHVIGVAAAFRDIRNATWRASVDVGPSTSAPKPLQLKVTVTGTSLAAAINEAATAPAAATADQEKE